MPLGERRAATAEPLTPGGGWLARTHTVPFVLVILYLLGICAAVLAPVYAARLAFKDGSAPAAKAETAVAARPGSTNPNRQPAWIAPTPKYGQSGSKQATSAMAKDLPQHKKPKKPQKRSGDR